MEYTIYGKTLKKILIDKNLRIYDVAKELNVSSAYVSAVITGKKNVPEGWNEIFKTFLNLNENDYKLLVETAERSKDIYKIDVTNCSELAKNTAYQFQRNFNDLDDETLNKLNQILSRRRVKIEQ